MARYILGQNVFFGGAQMRVGKVIDSLQYDIAAMQAAGALLIPIPNPIVEARAAEVRAQQAKGWRDGELTKLYATHDEDDQNVPTGDVGFPHRWFLLMGG
jgi:hypothetical protein